MTRNGMRPVHPGEVLREEYLRPLGMSASALARALSVPRGRIIDIARERRPVSPDTALRLACYFGAGDSDALGWLQLQSAYELKIAWESSWSTIEREVQPTVHRAAVGVRQHK
jgi:antitoxin HigA-1